jgi:hypothetical protein
VTRKLGRGRRFALFGGITSAVFLAIPLVWMSLPASAAGSITVMPNTGVTAGTSVTVSGSGFAANSTGTVIECSAAPGQPTIGVLGNPVPVSCTNPLAHVITTNASGDFTTTFTIVQGVTGPPATGTDSGGGDAATDAAAFPCPPTAAQHAAGVTCVIAFGDLAGERAIAPILFAGEEPPTTTTSSSSTTASSSTTFATTTTTASTTTTTASTTTTVPRSTTTTTAVPRTCKPGWGFGDKNHCHFGPPGLIKKGVVTTTTLP